MNARPRTALPLLVLVAAAGACADGASTPSTNPPVAGAEPTQFEPPAAPIDASPVVGRTGPDGAPFYVTRRTAERPAHLHRRIGGATFETALRTAGLTQYPCAACHAPGLDPAAAGDPDAHRFIQPVHPAEAGAACSSCHVPDAVDRLALQGGETATLDEAYRLCAQCHFRQADAWAAGAHGKRLDGWAGRRVLLNCTDCHDPHRPALEQRVPFPGPRIPRTGRPR